MYMSQPISFSQLGYRKPEAAKFVGLSPSKFMQLVKQERMPKPSKIDGCCVWDVRDLIKAFDELSGKNDGDWVI